MLIGLVQAIQFASKEKIEFLIRLHSEPSSPDKVHI